MADTLPVVVVVLSTFNGERYLREQLNSLLGQTYKNIKIVVRDDGSKDETCEILGCYLRDHNNVDVLFEHNIGVVASFLRLLDLVPPDAEYIALCDQDDVWKEDKIERAISLISRVEAVNPAMYCGAVEVVDEDLKHLGVKKQVEREPSLRNALVQNVATGCTTVLNRAALKLVTGKKIAVSKIGMHDWWLYQVISAFGVVLFDETPKILYRQHGGNVIGSSSGIKLWVNRIKRYLGEDKRRIRCQAEELLHVYGENMCKKNYKLVSEFLKRTQGNNIVDRLAYAIHTPVYRQRLVDDIILRTLIVFARI